MSENQTPNGVSNEARQESAKNKTLATGATVGGLGALSATEPTAWLWNAVIGGAANGFADGFPVMPEPVAAFFGALLLAAGYGVARVIRNRRA